jgi:hypothetical protein
LAEGAGHGSAARGRRRFDWGWENEDIVTHGSRALAIIATNSRQIAIRCDSYGDPTVPDDQLILINPRDVDLICQRLAKQRSALWYWRPMGLDSKIEMAGSRMMAE